MLVEAEIFNPLADGNLVALSSSSSQREAQKEFSTHALGGICALI